MLCVRTSHSLNFARTCSRACTDCLLPSYLPSAQSVFCREIVGFLCPQHKCESVALHTEELLYLIHSARRGRPEHFIANAYTRSPYDIAQGLSKKALTYTELIQKRLAPHLRGQACQQGAKPGGAIGVGRGEVLDVFVSVEVVGLCWRFRRVSAG